MMVADRATLDVDAPSSATARNAEGSLGRGVFDLGDGRFEHPGAERSLIAFEGGTPGRDRTCDPALGRWLRSAISQKTA